MTTIGTDASALLALPGGITLTQPVTVMQKGGGSTAPGIDNLSGTNILAGPITLVGGGTYWNIRSDSGDLIMQGASTVQSGLTGGRTLILSGNGNGEWWGNLSTSTANMSLSKQDGGTWTLWGTNSYPGGTSVSAGQLNVNGVLTGTARVTVGTDQMGSGAVLSGNGLITSPVTNTGGGTLCGNGVLPSGVPSGAPLGRLTISNSLTLKSASTTILGVSHSGCDQVVGLSQVTLGGTLQVVVTGTLAGGEAFKLFDSAAYSGDFDHPYNLPDLGPLLGWDDSSVAVNGTLRVTGASVPQVLSITSSGPGNLQFSGIGPTNGPTPSWRRPTSPCR
jgi:autotransporter-associated beta strand protein